MVQLTDGETALTERGEFGKFIMSVIFPTLGTIRKRHVCMLFIPLCHDNSGTIDTCS